MSPHPGGRVTCPHCGLEISDQLLRCPLCSKPTALAKRQNSAWAEVERGKRIIRRLMALVILMLIGLVLCWLWGFASGQVRPGVAGG